MQSGASLFSHSHVERFHSFKKADSLPQYYKFSADAEHWKTRPSSSFAKDRITAGRTEQNEWWKHAQSSNHSDNLTDAIYDCQNHKTIAQSLAKTEIRYKAIQTEHLSYPDTITSKDQSMGPGNYEDVDLKKCNQREPGRRRVGFGVTADRSRHPCVAADSPHRMLYTAKGSRSTVLTRDVVEGFSLAAEDERWADGGKGTSISTVRRGDEKLGFGVKPHCFSRPIFTTPNQGDEGGRGGRAGGGRRFGGGDDEDEDPWEWLLEKPGGEERMKAALKRTQDTRDSLRQLSRRARQTSALHEPKPKLALMKDEADRVHAEEMEMLNPTYKAEEYASIPANHFNDAGKVSVTVVFLNGRSVQFRVTLGESVFALKTLIMDKMGYAPYEQKLTVHGQRMTDRQALRDCGVEDKTTIRCVYA
jgi:hypothetical protein